MMKRILFVLAASVFASGIAVGQTITLGSDTDNPGGSVSIPLSYTAGQSVVGVQVDAFFDDSVLLSPGNSCSPQAGTTVNCAFPASGQVRITIDASDGTTPLPSGNYGSITFSIAGGASPGNYVIDFDVEGSSDICAQGPPSFTNVGCNANNGTVTVAIAAPEYSSNPSAGSTLNMGPVQQGSSDNANIVVTNVGDATLNVSNVSISGDTQGIFRVDPADVSFNLNPSSNRSVDFFCEPTGSTPAATHTATVTILTNDADEGSNNYTLSCQVTLPPSGVVVTLVEPPECSFGVCAFPDTVVNESSAPINLTLTNTDTTDSATGFNISTSNANFNQSNDCGSSLAPESSCNIAVTFTPVSVGQKSANLSVGGGNLQSGVSVSLSGTGLTDGGGGGDDDDDGGLLVLGPYASGSYFAGQAQNGHGWLVEVIGGTEASKGVGVFVVYWFAFLNGEQAWLVGSTTFAPGATSVTVPMEITSGGEFPDDPFDPDAVVKEDWGTLTFEFNDDCATGTMSWEATGDFEADFGSGSLPVVRITTVVDCPVAQ